jgi:hypothetical protein
MNPLKENSIDDLEVLCPSQHPQWTDCIISATHPSALPTAFI